GPFEIAVNTVGGLIGHPAQYFLDIDEQAYDDIMANNLWATFWCCRAEAEEMIKKRLAGRIVNIASIGGIRVMRNLAHYGTAKAGVIYLSQDLAIELAPHGIRVNCVSPGDTLTERVRPSYEAGQFKGVVAVNPLGRMATPEDMG